MASIEGMAANFRRLDQFARADTAIHRLDARAKVVATLAFIVVVASFDRYTVAALLPFFIFPIVLAALGKLPTAYVAGNVAVAIPFALAIGLFNPLFDQQVLFKLGAIPISAGWISCASIVVRAVLTLSAALILIGEPLAKLTLQGDFSLLWAKAGGAGGHFWHDTVTETNIITPAKWILPNAN